MKTILILMAFTVGAWGFQPSDCYELDEFEIGWYLEKLRENPEKNEKEIKKFELIQRENIQNEEELKQWKENKREELREKLRSLDN